MTAIVVTHYNMLDASVNSISIYFYWFSFQAGRLVQIVEAAPPFGISTGFDVSPKLRRHGTDVGQIILVIVPGQFRDFLAGQTPGIIWRGTLRAR